MQQSNLSLFCAKYNQHLSWKKKTFVFVGLYTKNSFSFVCCMDRNRFVQAYHCIVNELAVLHTINSRFNLRVYPLFYANHPLTNHLSLRSTKKQFFPFSLFDITKFRRSIRNTFTPLLMLQTNLGLATHNEALELHRGGLLWGVLYRFYR